MMMAMPQPRRQRARPQPVDEKITDEHERDRADHEQKHRGSKIVPHRQFKMLQKR